MKQKYIFLLVGLLFSIYGRTQNNYEVSQIPFQTYSVSSSPLTTGDDLLSNYIPLGFDFAFFGNAYNQILISTNGYITFEGTPVTFSPWSFNTSIPNPSFPVKNAIFGCYHDMNNSNGTLGAITYGVVGSAPYRKFVLLFDNQPHFQCSTLLSTFQIILYETFNTIDVQIVDKPVCTTWNGGNAVTGIINTAGTIGLTPAGRNTGAWTASQEGYRFKLPFASNVYYYTICDDDTDGLGVFNLTVAQNDINPSSPSTVLFYETLQDAQNNINGLTDLNYTNSQSQQTIYAFSEGVVYDVKLQVIDCANDFDADGVPTAAEDLNGDGNLANDDTDNDGIPNFADNDDDGDTVLTEFEYVFNRNGQTFSGELDTDTDLIPDYLDDDDDGDGVLTKDEDYNGNFDPTDDDINSNSIPDYLDDSAFLGTSTFENEIQFVIYPNPASSVINIENNNSIAIKEVEIFSIDGQLLKKINSKDIVVKIDISEFQSGIYFIKLNTEKGVFIRKFLKK